MSGLNSTTAVYTIAINAWKFQTWSVFIDSNYFFFLNEIITVNLNLFVTRIFKYLTLHAICFFLIFKL